MEHPATYMFQSTWKLSKDLRRDIELFIADYSSGKSIHDLAEKFQEILNHPYKPSLWNLFRDGDYYLCISMASIAALFGAEESFQASNLFPHNDYLIAYILGRMDAHHYSIKTKMRIYHRFKRFIANQKDDTPENLLKHFYSSFGKVKWFNSHLGQHNLFFGYWSFTFAVLVKKLELDDLLYNDHMFYPRDFVVDKGLRKSWENSLAGREARGELDYEIDTDLNSNLILQEEIFDFYERYLKEIRDEFLKNEFGVRLEHSIEISERKKLLFDIAEAMKGLSDMKVFDHAMTQKQFVDSIERHFQIEFENITFDNGIGLKSIINSEKAQRIKKDQIVYLNNLAGILIQLDDRFEFTDLSYWFQLDELLVDQNLKK